MQSPLPPPTHPTPAVSLFYAALPQASLVYSLNALFHRTIYGPAEQNTVTVLHKSEKMFDTSCKKYQSNRPMDEDSHWSARHFTGHRPADQREFRALLANPNLRLTVIGLWAQLCIGTSGWVCAHISLWAYQFMGTSVCGHSGLTL